MKASLFVCCALVAMAIPAYATGKNGADSVVVSGSLSVSKDAAPPAGAAAAETPNPSAIPNPSEAPAEATATTTPSEAPAEATTTGPKVALSAAVIDVNVKKVPVVTLSDAPCQKICSDKCSISLEKVCNKVPVTQKKCKTVQKPVVKHMCSKKCTYTTLAVETSTTPTNANPSATPSAQANPSTPIDGSAASSTTATDGSSDTTASVEVTKSGSDSFSLGKGRKLQTILPLKAVAKAVSALGHDHKADCVDVCEDVASTVPDVVCEDVTTEVEKCSVVPKQNCQKECVCIPMKHVSLKLPVNPIKFSLSGGKGSTAGDSSDASASVGTLAGKGK